MTAVAAEGVRPHRAVVRPVPLSRIIAVELRKIDALCPRDGAPMARGTVGGRTTWWCSREQAG